MPKQNSRFWFQEAIKHGAKEPTGWSKDLPRSTRRNRMLRAHKYAGRKKYLRSAQALQALSNVTKNPETKIKAKIDAEYFYALNRKLG